MSRHTKDKRKKQQLKKETEVKEEKIVFDVLDLLKHENLDTKPNMAKFLKTYVKSITGNPKTKPAFYPIFEIDITKWFVKFLDGHELIFTVQPADAAKDLIFYYYFTDEIEMKNSEISLVKAFFDKLMEFKFLAVPAA